MFTDRIAGLYRALDYEQISEAEGFVRCFHRVEGADHAYELVWIVEGSPSQDEYNQFAYELQRVVNRPGNKRQRIVAAEDVLLGELERFRLASEVGRYTWVTLVNDLFHSDRFCEKVRRDYNGHAALVSERMKVLGNVSHCEYRYIPQLVRERNGWGPGTVWDQFVTASLLSEGGGPALFLVQAPAGYGKTSLSFEIAKFLADLHLSSPSAPFPLFIPFAKYRKFGGVRDILRREIEELKLYGVNSEAL